MQQKYIIWCHQKISRKKLQQGPGKQIHCVKSTKIERFFLVCIFPYLDWIRTRKNAVFGHFWRNDYCNTFNLISFLRKILFFYKRLLIYMSWNSLDLKAWAEHTLRLECSPGYLGRFCLCPSNEKISWLFYFKPQSCTEENVIRWIFTFTLG